MFIMLDSSLLSNYIKFEMLFYYTWLDYIDEHFNFKLKILFPFSSRRMKFYLSGEGYYIAGWNSILKLACVALPSVGFSLLYTPVSMDSIFEYNTWCFTLKVCVQNRVAEFFKESRKLYIVGVGRRLSLRGFRDVPG